MLAGCFRFCSVTLNGIMSIKSMMEKWCTLPRVIKQNFTIIEDIIEEKEKKYVEFGIRRHIRNHLVRKVGFADAQSHSDR